MVIWSNARNSKKNIKMSIYLYHKNVQKSSRLQVDLSGSGHVRRSISPKTIGSADVVNVFIKAESVSRATEKRARVTSMLVGLRTFFESRLAKNRCLINVVTRRVSAGRLTYAECLPLRRNDIVNRTREEKIVIIIKK